MNESEWLYIREWIYANAEPVLKSHQPYFSVPVFRAIKFSCPRNRLCLKWIRH